MYLDNGVKRIEMKIIEEICQTKDGKTLGKPCFQNDCKSVWISKAMCI